MGGDTREPKVDCFAFEIHHGYKQCKALNELYCSKEECKFYKPSRWRNITNGGNGTNQQ